MLGLGLFEQIRWTTLSRCRPCQRCHPAPAPQFPILTRPDVPDRASGAEGHARTHLPQRTFGSDATRDSAFPLIGTFASFHPHRRFCCEGEPAEFVYRIVAGVAQGYRVSTDGRRQILHFYTPGNLFGFESGPHYTIFVDSVTDGRIQIMKRTAIDKLITTNSSASSELVVMPVSRNVSQPGSDCAAWKTR